MYSMLFFCLFWLENESSENQLAKREVETDERVWQTFYNTKPFFHQSLPEVSFFPRRKNLRAILGGTREKLVWSLLTSRRGCFLHESVPFSFNTFGFAGKFIRRRRDPTLLWNGHSPLLDQQLVASVRLACQRSRRSPRITINVS